MLAAFTSPPLIDRDPMKALEVNINGTCNVVKICEEFGLRLVYISTDYVFKGERGKYQETDPVYPVNKYACSKLGRECAARLYEKALIIRTTFDPNVSPYEKAFIDQWTSLENVSVIAHKINVLIEKDVNGVVHFGGDRKTVYKYACQLDPNRSIDKLSIRDIDYIVPIDTSLDCGKYKEIIRQNFMDWENGL